MPFEEFYSAYRPYVERVIWAMVGKVSPDQVEDLIQETFLRAWKAYGRVNSLALHAWIARIAHNVAIDNLRSLQVRKRHTSTWNDEAAAQIPDRGNTAQAFYHEEFDLVKRTLAYMKPTDREVLLLISQGYKTGEIAAHLDLDYGRCKQRVMRARARFRERYLALCG